MINEKRVILVVGLLLFLTAIKVTYGINDNSSIYLNLSNNYVKLEKQNYNLGEQIIINLSIVSDFELYIYSANKVYSYTSINNSIVFIPEKAGNYSIQLKIGNSSENLSFAVDLNSAPSLFTDKEKYYLGDSVIIYLNNIDENYTISINSLSNAYDYFGNIESPIEFKPISVGAYQINAKNKNDNITLTKKFAVNAPDKTKGSIFLYTDKNLYYKGEEVTIYLNFTKKDSYVFYINSEDGIYKYLGVLQDKLFFKPESIGRYIVKIEEGDKVLASSSFTVIEKPAGKELEIFYLDKDVYDISEIVNVQLNFYIPLIEIILGDESVKYYNATEVVTFKPQKAGNYTVNAYIENLTVSKNFTVIQEEVKRAYAFNINKEAIIDFNLKPVADKKRSILNIIFGTSPIEQVRFYVENYSDDSRFNLSAEQISKENFRIAVKAGGVNPGIYKLIAEMTINGELLYDKKIFLLEESEFSLPEAKNESENESKKQIELIKNYINYSFTLNEDAVIDVDFTKEIDVKRSVLDLILRSSKLEQLTAFVEGHELNEDFNLSITRIEFDKFSIRIKNNANIPADVYRVVAIGKISDRTFIQQKKFNWGIINFDTLLERINLKNRILDQEKQKLNLFTNKRQYALGERVHIYTDADISELQVKHQNNTFKFFGSASDISFAPQSEGTYLVEAQIKGIEGVLTTNFSVGVNASLSQKEVMPFSLNIKNGRMENVPTNLKFYKHGTLVKIVEKGKENEEYGTPFEIDDYDVDLEPQDSAIKKVSIKNLKFNGSIDFGLDRPINEIKKVDKKLTAEVYAIDAGSINFTSAIVSVTAKGTELYKCKDWNFASRSCQGSWEKFMDLIPGKEYSFNLTSGDPGFAETGLASINTNKSIYHLNEEVKILMVVLDKEGHLVSGADIILNVTNPANAVATFTTSNDSVIGIEKGIYESIYTSTSLEGNYSVFVRAIGDNVNNSMLSFFTVKQFYEFDILRNTPVTTDPWKGAFASSIKIVSLINTLAFNFSEALPVNFTITHKGNAIESITNDKKILTWSNLANNSIVSYSAKPPLITPELWELGPSVVSYQNNKFEEAKPWFLAVDPLCAPDCSTNTKGESGEAVLSTTQTELDVDLINEYVLNKTFIIARHHGAATPTGAGIPPNEHTGTVMFLDNNTIRINRYATGSRDSRATYSIIQADNIQVWNFTRGWGSADTSVNVTLSPNLPSNYNNKCFVELWRNTRVDSADADCTATAQVVSNLSNSTNLNLRRITNPANCAGSVSGNTSGFVVCFLDSTTVQTNETVADIEGGTNVNFTNSINVSNSWLTFNYMVDDDGLEQISVRGNITGNRTLAFYRNRGETTAGTVTLRWYVIEFEAGKSGFVERQGQNAVDNAVTELNITFSNAYDMNRTLAHCSENYDAGEGNAYPRVWWSAFFVNSTTISQNRGRTGAGGDTTDHQCQAIQWPSTTSLETGVDDVKPRMNASLNNSEPQINYVVNLTANVSDETGLSFCQFVINQSNGAKQFFNQSLSGANAQCSQNFTIALDTGNVINFTAIVNDTANNINSSQFIVTVRGSPIVTLDSPANNSIETDLNVSLKCSAVEDRDIVNLTLYTNSTGQFIQNQTFNVSGSSDTSTSFIFNLSLTEAKVFIWNCLSFDNESLSRFAPANFTVHARVPAEGFTDITSLSNISNRTAGRGVCAEDYDKNGLVDVVLLGDNKGGINLFNNTGSNFFKNDSTSLNSGYSLAGRACSFGDFNNDDFPDFVTASDLILYKNNKNNTLNCTDSEDDSACSGAVLPVTTFTGKGIQWLDYNDDSYLDLFAPDTSGAYIFKNNGDGNFSLVTVGSDTIDEYTAVADYDNDGNLDLFAVDGTVHIIYKNNGNSTFTKIDAASIGLPNRTRGTGDDAEDFHWGFGDYDNDDDLDVFITSTGAAERNFFENDGDGTFTEKTTAAGLPTDDVGTNPIWGDYNNDGYLDLLIGGKGIYKNNKDKTFSEVSSNLSIASPPESAQFADIDNDGDLDILGQNKSGVSIVYRNDLNDPNYLKILVKGIGNRSNHNFSSIDAIGAKIRVYNSSNSLVCFREISGGSSYGQSPKMQHCGLKPLLTYNVSVEFPSGLSKNTTVSPSSASLTIGDAILVQTIQINESEKPPATTLVAPAPSDVDQDGIDVTFVCNATDDIDIANISLFHNASGAFKINQTSVFNANDDLRNTTNFTANFTLNVIVWNCLTYDTAGNSAFASQNRTLTVGTDTLNVDVYTDSTIYGTNEVAAITANTTNSANNPINATTTTDIVFGATTSSWWNTSFTFREPIFLSHNANHTNVTVQINISGLGGNIVSCVNDTRIVKNGSIVNELINSTVVDGDNSTYCIIRFNAEVHNANESNYHVYYKNNTGSNPSFTISQGLLVKNVQKGIISLLSTETSTSVNISAVNTSKSFLVFNLQVDDNRPDRTLIRGNLSNSTTLRFLREASGTSAVIQWYVVEFESGVNVQRGSTPVSASPTDITISSVDLNKSVPLISWDNAGGAFGSDDFVRANLTSTTNLRIIASAVNTVDVEWQIIEFAKDAKVQKGDVNFASIDATQTATIEAVNLNRSFTIATWTASANGLDENFIRPGFVDKTTIIFEREATGTTIGLTYFVVELNTSSVQSATLNFTGTETLKNVKIDSIGINNSIAFLSGNQRGGSSDYTADDNPGTGWFTTNITNSTNLEIRRGTDTESAISNITFFVVEFYGLNSVKSSLGGEQKFITRNENDTDADGVHQFNFSTSNQQIGLYSIVSVANKVSYNDAKDFTSFNITSGGEVPVITVDFPISGSTISNAQVDLNATTSKNANCKYSTNQLFDYETQGTLFATTGSTSHSTNLGALAEGSHTYYIKCKDSQGNTNNNENQGSTTFAVDRTPPSISLIQPANNSNQTSSTITFSWTATDNIDTSISCNLTVNGVVEAPDLQSQSGVQRDFAVALSNGNYTWNVTCIDNAPNYNASVTNRFTLSIVDLVLSIQTLNTSYKQNRYVNLTKRSILQSGDIESSIQSTLFPINTHVYVPNETTNRAFYIEEDCNGGTVPPANGPDPSCGGVHQIFTAIEYNSASVGDDVDVSMACGANDEDYLIYNLSVDEDLNSILSINWSFEGALSATTSTTLEFFLWNYTGASWSRCAANLASTTDTFVNCSIAANATNFINSTTKLTTFLTQCNENEGVAKTVTTDFIQFVVKYYTNKTDGNSSYVNYTFENSNNLTKLSDINVKITVEKYNNSVSNTRGNAAPDLEIGFYNGSNYTYTETCSLNSITNDGANLPVNCSVTVTNKTILKAWNVSNNRRIRVRGISIDQAREEQDFINWSSVFVELHTPSEIENVGPENSTRRLLLQVLRNTTNGFVSHATIYNNTITIASNSSRNLSDFWDTSIFLTNNYPLGAYMAYAALIASDNTVLLNGDNSPLNDTYIFFIDYLRINITSPLNNSIQDAGGFYINVSLENITFKSGGNCSYSIDGQPNITMSNESQIKFFNFTNIVEVGLHNVQVFCNDTSGEFSSSYVYNFSVEDLTSPIVRIVYPANNSEVANGNVTLVYNVTDFTSNISNCTLILDFQDNVTNYSVAKNVNQTFNLTGLTDEQHRWQVRCTDNSSNKNVGLSDEFVFLVGIDNNAPVVTLISPANNTFTQDNDVVFKYTAFDEPVASNIANCSLIINNKINQTNSTILTGAGQVNNFTLINMPVAEYNWSVNCTDSSQNKNVGSSKIFNLSIGEDTDAPVVNLISPVNNITDTDGSVLFSFNVTDLSGGIYNCTMIINGTINQTDTSIQEAAEQTFSVSGFNDGFYNWRVNCTDDSFQRNANGSEIRNFTVTKLLNMFVQLTTDKSVYEKGTDFNESAIINTTTKDSLNNLINTTVTSDVIKGNTSLSWWNASWAFRKPIFINETTGANRTNAPISVNITGLNGNINNCDKEIRIVYNKSQTNAVIPRKILGGDDSTYCLIMFNANITANSTNEDNYYAYYNNTNAVAPADVIAFEPQEYVNATFEEGNESFVYGDDFYGGTSNAAEEDGSRTQSEHCPISANNFCLNVSLNTVPDATGGWSGGWNITFNITEPNVIVNITFNFTLILSVTTEAGEFVNLSFRNISNGAVITGANIEGSAGNPPPQNHYINGSINYTEFISSTGLYSFDVGCFLADVNANDESGSCWIDNVRIKVINGSAPGVKSSEGTAQELRKREVNDTGLDGLFSYQFNSTNHSTGVYSVVSVSVNPSYNTNYNYTLFTIRTDQTPPFVNLVSPENSFISATGNITFVYNVSDTTSNISDCKLLIDGVVVQTNTTVTENIRQNFTRYEIGNGAHTWQVNCTDGLGNKNGSAIRNFDVQVDTLGPGITLIAPNDGYNDTNGRIEFSFSVNDQFNGVANCSLLINITNNQTIYNVTEAATQTLYSNITDGVYNWSVRCTDNSSNFNVNTSLTRRFNVIVDTVPPIISLILPSNNSQLVSGNITFVYNVTDVISNISNCSIFINGMLNITNRTVTENINQTFNITGIANGYHNWSIFCVDGSENNNSAMSVNLTFLVSPDNVPPIVTLVNPPNATEDPDGNITLTYNVTDFASDIKNCTLFINHTRNLSTLDVPEDSEQSFSLFNVPDGVYTWQVNCTDTALIENTGNSSIRFFIIGADVTPPTVTLESPLNNSNDSNGVISFQYNVIDFGSNIKNCSILINETLNQTNTSVAESITQTFAISEFNNGTFGWKVSCTDNSTQQNTGNSSSRLVRVINDIEKPIVNLVAPANQSSDSDGNVLFVYNVSDELNGIGSCRLYIDNTLQGTNTSVQENANQSFRVSGLGDGTYQWFANCTDNSDNQNVGQSPTRTLVVQNDIAAPVVALVNPPDHTLETDGSRIFFYNVTDAISGIASCELIFNGAVQQTDTGVLEGVTENFTVTSLTNGQRNWSVNCTDNSENSNEGASLVRNITVTLDSAAPVVSLVSPLNNTQNILNNVTFIFNITDTSEVSNCSIYINGTLNSTKYNVSKDINVNFTINNFNNVTINWNIDCVDKSEDSFRDVSENRTLIIGPDTAAPAITLLNPPNNIQDPDGNVVFDYNVSDFASNIANCSLIINSTINQTNTSIKEGITQNFTLNGIINGNYIWQVNCTDNSTTFNVGSSELRNLTIGADTTAPTVTLIAPANNTLYNSENVVYEYSAIDFASDIKNCSLILNNKINATNITIIEGISQFLNVFNQEDSTYNWSVNCTDTFNNTGTSSTFNLTVFRPKQIFVNVSTDNPSYEQGSIATITVNVTNASNAPFVANLTIDIIKGNATVPWWNTSFHYRVPLIINASSRTRIDKLVELPINFTDILINDIGLSGLNFDNNSIRVLEFDGNSSIEIPSQFEAGEPFNSVNSSHGTLYWIVNSTIQVNKSKEYYIYFDATENGQKTAPGYSKPSFSFRGSAKNVLFDNSLTSASHVIINRSNNTFTLMFADSDGIFNQLYTDYQGAGSIINITVNGNRITNDNSSIAPVAVKDDDYLITNSTSTVESGAVVSFVSINSSINSITGSAAQINYTIWFAGSDIYLRAKLYARFESVETAPIDLYSNLWFAYLFDEGDSSWNNFVNTLNSKEYNDTHNYFTTSANLSELNAFHVSDWYSELKAGLGSLNLFVQNFSLNGANNTIGVVSFDDARLPAGTQSDGVGFNLNSDQTIAAGDTYSMTVWMKFSSDGTSKAEDLKNDIEAQLVTARQQGQRLINRTINESSSNGLFAINFSTVGKTTGFYSAVARSFKTLYTQGINYKSFEITLDATKPIVNAISPEGFINTANTTFTYNVSETNSIANCSVVINNKINTTNSSVTNNAQNTIIVYNIAEGSYNWSVNCSDAAGNIGNSSIKNITVDLTKPTINLSYPSNGATFNFTNIEFNFTAIDNFDTLMLCNVTVDGTVQGTLNATNGAMANTTIALTQGNHKWNVTCQDDAGNVNTSETRTFTIDLGAPTITLNNPANNSFTQIQNLTLDYTPSSLTLSNCTLIVNDAANQTNITPVSDAENRFKLENRSEGKLQWAVNCTDSSGDVGASGTFNVFIDLTSPNVTLLAPESGYIINDSIVQLNFTVLDNLDSTLDCNVTINSTVNNTQLINAVNNTVVSYNASSFADGLFFWNVTCFDSANNTNTSLTRNFTVQDPPNIILGNPVNATKTKNRNQTFFYTPSDNSGSISNCTLVINNKLNITNTSVTNNIQNNLSVLDLEDNAYNWTVNCTDVNGNIGTNDSQKVIYIDNLGPSIILNTPFQGQTFNQNDISFNFTSTDQFGLNTTLDCNITLDGVINVSNVTVISGNANVTLINDLADGTHNWNATCLDDLNNSNTSITVSFIINQPDLTLNISNIVFNNSAPVEGDNITINATILNKGGIAANNILVRVYNGNPSALGTQIDADRTIATLDTGKNTTVNVTWTALLGLHEIFVTIDPNNAIAELNETNNNASRNISVPIWHTIAGNVTGNLLLESIGNRTAFSWNISAATSGNIFVIDSDSSITWTNLTALGRNISGGNASNDWQELDAVINTTSYPDSINRTFTSDYVPINVTSFVVFANTIYNVSIANSTNNTNFVTGILWDKSDETGDGQFNGSEDIVFITEIKRSEVGKYGVYDFEIRAPSLLKRYKSPDLSSVTFYVELR